MAWFTTLPTQKSFTNTALGANSHLQSHIDLEAYIQQVVTELGLQTPAAGTLRYRMNALESANTTNVTNIGTNTTNIATNTSNIATNSTNITALTARFPVQTTDYGNATVTRGKLAATALPELHIPLAFNLTASNGAYTTYDQCKVTIDFSKLITGLTAAYFVSNMNAGTTGTVFCQFWNVSDNVAIVASEISTAATVATEVRSADIKGNLPAVSKLMSIQAKNNATSAYALQIVQLVLNY